MSSSENVRAEPMLMTRSWPAACAVPLENLVVRLPSMALAAGSPLVLVLAAQPVVASCVPVRLAEQLALAALAAKAMEWAFQPPLSWATVRICWPAGRVTLAVTVAQVCQPPVAGTLMLPDRLVPELLAMWRPSVTPLAADRRKL